MPFIPLTMAFVVAFVVIVPLAMLALVLAPERLNRPARKVRRAARAGLTPAPIAAPATVTVAKRAA